MTDMGNPFLWMGSADHAVPVCCCTTEGSQHLHSAASNKQQFK